MLRSWKANLAEAPMPPVGILREVYHSPPANGSLSQIPGIPRVESIQPCPDLARGHFFSNQILKEDLLNSEELNLVLHDPRARLVVAGVAAGTVPASVQTVTSYSKYAWTRDAAIIASALASAGHVDRAAAIIENLALFYGSNEQRGRIMGFLFDPNPNQKFSQGRDLPFIRAKIDKNGAMIPGEESAGWTHAQIDAFGAWLATTFRLLSAGALQLEELQKKLEAQNAENRVESVLVSAFKFLGRLPYWDALDFSVWEERLGHKRASSTGLMVAAARELKRYGDTFGWERLTIAPNADGSAGTGSFRAMVDHMIERGSACLRERVPDRPDAYAIETDTTGVPREDAALALLLDPAFDVGLTLNQQHAILRTVYNLMGKVGFRRYRNDPYVGMDYPRTGNCYLMSDPGGQNYKEAEWCFFDSILASYFAQRFIGSDRQDIESLRYAQQHLKRSLSHVTSGQEGYILLAGPPGVAMIPRGVCPEAYFFDSQGLDMIGPCWRPNSNSPLNWTTASLAKALRLNIKAVEELEDRTRQAA